MSLNVIGTSGKASQRFHVSPNTGKPGRCSEGQINPKTGKTSKCRWPSSPHIFSDSLKEARSVHTKVEEKKLEKEYGKTPTVKKEIASKTPAIKASSADKYGKYNIPKNHKTQINDARATIDAKKEVLRAKKTAVNEKKTTIKETVKANPTVQQAKAAKAKVTASANGKNNAAKTNSHIDFSNAKDIKVGRVIDGDTVVLDDGTRIRFVGIDAPEMDTQEGVYARYYLKNILDNSRNVKMTVGNPPLDRWGRTRGVLKVEDANGNWHYVHDLMMASGHATPMNIHGDRDFTNSNPSANAPFAPVARPQKPSRPTFTSRLRDSIAANPDPRGAEFLDMFANWRTRRRLRPLGRRIMSRLWRWWG